MHTAVETRFDLPEKLSRVLREANYWPTVGGLALYAAILLAAMFAEMLI